tara:strand:+ start:1392 stop:2042 length:651 start_codon:yes stop_codon:yes gene_type:complete
LNLNQNIDIYCERLTPGILAEPVNFITNIAFFLSFIFLLKQYKSRTFNDNATDKYSLILLCLVLLMGVGSFIFHLYGTVWAAIADTTPIMVFIILYLYLSIRFYLGQRRIIAILAVVAFLFLNSLLSYIGIEEISSYLMALFSMFVISILAYVREEYDISIGLLISSLIFIISLSFRQIDALSCSYLTIGTHWVWHILNAILLYVLVILFMDKKLR